MCSARLHVFTIAAPSRITASTVGMSGTFIERHGWTSDMESSVGVNVKSAFLGTHNV